MPARWRLDLGNGVALLYSDGATMLLKSGRLRLSLSGTTEEMRAWKRSAVAAMNELAGASDQIPFESLTGISKAVAEAVLFWERELAK